MRHGLCSALDPERKGEGEALPLERSCCGLVQRWRPPLRAAPNLRKGSSPARPRPALGAWCAARIEPGPAMPDSPSSQRLGRAGRFPEMLYECTVFLMEQCSQAGPWIDAVAARLQRRWPTIALSRLEEQASDLWSDGHLRAMEPERAAAEWLRPVTPVARDGVESASVP